MRAVKPYQGVGADANVPPGSLLAASVHGMRIKCHVEESKHRPREVGSCAGLSRPDLRRHRSELQEPLRRQLRKGTK